MSPKLSNELVKHRLEQAKSDVNSAQILYNIKDYKGANNRAYYAIFHARRAILALEPIDFKRHKDVQAYFNKNYVNEGIFDKKLGKRISEASRIREDSDYDDEFVAKYDVTEHQIETASVLIEEIEKYINEKM